MTGDGVHVELSIRPTRQCPAASLVADRRVYDFVDGDASNAPQIVVDDTDPEALEARSGVEAVLSRDGRVVCRCPKLATREPDTCEHDHCLFRGLGFLPLQPYRRRWVDGVLHLSLATTDREAITDCLHRLDEAGFGVTTEQIVSGDVESGAESTVVNVAALTRRQREVAELAVERRYFESDGPPAAVLADELDITKSTLSEHLRVVQSEILTQALGADGGTSNTE